MIEIVTVAALLLIFRFLVKKRNKENSSADEKENNCRRQQPASIVGESRFVLDSERKKQAKTTEPDSDSPGKLDIEVPLDYKTEDTDIMEEQEELKRLGLESYYSSNITFDEMMTVVNEVGSDQVSTTPKTGRLLYENENTDWVEQLASSSENSANRIASLIDLHLGRLAQPNLNGNSDDRFRGFDIGEYV